jgi:hypothetical protein
MRHLRIAAAVTVAVAASLAAPALARADAVMDWNQNAVDVIIRPTSTGAGFAGQPPPVSVLHLAMVHAAVYDAVNAIDGGYQPYLGPLAADPLYSQDAAAIVAAHDVLVGFPFLSDADKTALTAKRDLALMAIADGPAKTGGMAVGAAAAARVLQARANDGRFGPFRFPGNLTGIGEWRPTPPTFANDPNAWVARVTPFLIGEADRFRGDGPYAVSSPEYAAEYDEVKSLGSATSTTRSADQTDAARFWVEHPPSMWTRVVRQLSAANGLSLAENSRLFAMVYLTASDGVIAAWHEKAHWLFWRPITAIQLGDNDGNPATVGDPTWTPLIGNPPYPDHVSGHTTVSGSFLETLKDFFGTDKMDFSATSTNSGTTRSFDRFTKAEKEIIGARVWSGIHFLNADIDGYHLAKRIATYRDRNYFQPVG